MRETKRERETGRQGDRERQRQEERQTERESKKRKVDITNGLYGLMCQLAEAKCKRMERGLPT